MLNSIKNIYSFFHRYFFNEKISGFILFLIIAAIFWSLNALSKSYTTVLKYPIDFKNIPAGKILVSDDLNLLNVKITCTGHNIIQYKINAALSSLTIDLAHYPPQQAISSSNDYFFSVINPLHKKISELFHDETILVSIHPDTIYYTLNESRSRKVPVIAKLRINYQKFFAQSSDLTLEPDSIFIVGPCSIADTISAILSESSTINNANDTIFLKLKLQQPPHTALSQQTIQCIIPVDRLTEKTIEVPVTCIHLSDSLVLKTFPGKVQITFLVALNQFSKLKPSDFKVFINYDSIKKTGNKSQKLIVSKKPNYIYNLTLNPPTVEYLLEHKKRYR